MMCLLVCEVTDLSQDVGTRKLLATCALLRSGLVLTSYFARVVVVGVRQGRMISSRRYSAIRISAPYLLSPTAREWSPFQCIHHHSTGRRSSGAVGVSSLSVRGEGRRV
jgi:hypothetical protein